MSNYTIEVTENVVNLDVLKDHDIVIEIKSSDNFITFDTPSGYPIAYTSGILAVNRMASGYLIENLTSGNTIVRTFGDQNIAGYKTFSNDVVTSGNLAIRSQPAFISPSYFPVFISDPSTFSRNIYTRTPSQIKSDLGINNVQNIALSGINFSAGSGLVGGGNLSSSRTFDIGQGDGLTVSADSVGVNSTVIRTSGDQTIAGFTTFSGSGIRITTGAIGPYRKDIVFKANVGTLFSNTVTITPTNNLYTDRTYYLPEAGADADFVLTAGSQVITGPKTFTNSLIFNSGSFQSLRVGVTDVSLSGHTHTSSNITDFNTSVDSRITNANLQPSGNYSIVGHNHTVSNITDFASGVNSLTSNLVQTTGNQSVSGIKTFKNKLIVEDTIQINGSGTGATILLDHDTFGGVSLSTDLTTFNPLGWYNKDVYLDNGTIGDISINADFGKIKLFAESGISIVGSSLQFNGTDISVSGHTHTSSNITNFNASVSGLVSGIYAPLNSPSFTGTPLTPTASAGTNNTQIASTAFVRTEISNLVASAPSSLDTLNELATALGNDANFSTTVTNNLAGKANLSGATFTGSISGPSGNFTSLKVNNVDVSANGHTHTSSNITDFNSSVSGLLPVKNIISGTDIAVSNVDGTYTISSTTSGVPQVYSTVFNNTGSPIPKMTVVYINGGQGDMPTVALSIANSEMTSSKTYAVTTETIPNMSSGRVIISGPLTAVNTDQFNPTAPNGNVNGTTVWLSPTVSGGLTTSKPLAPYHMVSIGTIVRTHQTQGIIEVKIQNGFELYELHDVAVSGVSNGQFLQYNSASGLWLPSVSGNFSALSVNDNPVYHSGILPNPVTGVGTSGYLTKWISSSGVSSGVIFDNGTNVGIGTSSPSGKLDINGTLYVGTTGVANNFYIRTGQAGISETALKLRSDTSSNLYLDASNAYVKVGNQSADVDIAAGNAGIRIGNNSAQTLANQNIRFVPANTEIMRITPTGVGVGTTTPSSQLHVVGTGTFDNSIRLGSSSTSGTIIGLSTSGTVPAIIFDTVGNNHGNSQVIYDFRENGISMISIDGIGNLQANNGSITATAVNPSVADTSIPNNAAFVGHGMRRRLTNAGMEFAWGESITSVSEPGIDLFPVGGTHISSGILFRLSKDSNKTDVAVIVDGSGRVGVGTSTPSSQLHVIGSGIFSSGITVGNGLSNSYIYASINPNTNNVRFNYGGGDRIDFNSSQLFYNGTSYFQGDNYVLRVGETTSTASQKDSYQFIFQNALWDGAASQYAVSMIKSLASTSQNMTSRLAFFTHNGINNTQVERMCVTSSGGYVGIGTTTPSNRLEVAGGDVLIGPSDSTRQLSFFNNSYGIKAQSGLEIFTGDIIRFRKGSTEYARIDTNGKVGVGTTTPSTQLHVIGSGTFSNSVSIGSSTLSDSNLPSIINSTNLYLWSNFN